MSIYRLINLAGLNHLSEYSVEDLITSFGLYQKAIINLKDIRIPEGNTDEYVLVSKDVERLNELLTSKSNIMLPCADCGEIQPFHPQKWSNPQTIHGPVEYGISKTQNTFEISVPRFKIGENRLNKWGIENAEKARNQEKLNNYIKTCVEDIKIIILETINEARKDYTCAFIPSHRVFVQFRIFDPIEPEDYDEFANLISSEHENDKKACEALNCLHGCLVIEKVGQYPSLADMQLFDISKYRKILGKESYSDFTKAIGLYADGIGCGSFLYLRRIFERLIEEKHQACAAAEAEAWDEEQYNQFRVNERIDLLEEKGYCIIPDELSEIKESLYGVLSKGVHESTDVTCAEMFPALKFIIESILDEQIRQREKDEKLREIRSKLRQMQ